MNQTIDRERVKKKYARLRERLENAVCQKEFYEAHQLYRTLYNRMQTNDVEETINLLHQGSEFLLINKQSESGADLVLMLLKYVEKQKVDIREEEVLRLKRYFSLMAVRSEERRSVLRAVRRQLRAGSAEAALWSEWVAVQLWREGDWAAARSHLLVAGSGVHAGLFLAWLWRRHSRLEVERDLLLAQAVLQLLCLGHAAAAERAFSVYVASFPELQPGPPFKCWPLLNFCWLLLLAAQAGKSSSVFRELVAAYDYQLRRDPSYPDLLDRVGQRLFGESSASSSGGTGGGDFLSNIMSGLLSTGGAGASTEFAEADDMD